ncbi:ubiquitin-like protein 7 isoform X1 [Dreissena polymorpha]|uniref:ubiquitin-like protein 7 isoform X1 n=1 Tax=Dreissena polymorpha TaxID=45954 RepID=UPI002263D40A|nr:ubiquitin-like protein 7 isoform X1 [Dreissena polymorpha]
MATITICDRRKNGISERKRVTVTDLNSNISNLKILITSQLTDGPLSYELVYCGNALKDESTMRSCGLHTGSTVYLLSKSKLREEDPDPSQVNPSKEKIKQLMSVLQGALKSPAYKSTVEGIMTSPEKLQEIVNAVPGLNSNPSTLNLFMDPSLLSILAHPGNIGRLLESHPSFVRVAELISEQVKEAGRTGNFTTSSTHSYSLDHMSDEEEEAPAAVWSGSTPITANQLAAALATATGAGPSTSTAAQGHPRPITQDFFQQAILQAQSSTITSQLQQMQEMGITDENVARQALQATNGDLQAAIDLIFGGEFN